MAHKRIVRTIHHPLLTLSLLVALALLAGESTPTAAVFAQAAQGKQKQVGLLEGDIAPHFQAADQFGKQQTDVSIAGKNGTVLLFFRSADW